MTHIQNLQNSPSQSLLILVYACPLRPLIFAFKIAFFIFVAAFKFVFAASRTSQRGRRMSPRLRIEADIPVDIPAKYRQGFGGSLLLRCMIVQCRRIRVVDAREGLRVEMSVREIVCTHFVAIQSAVCEGCRASGTSGLSELRVAAGCVEPCRERRRWTAGPVGKQGQTWDAIDSPAV